MKSLACLYIRGLALRKKVKGWILSVTYQSKRDNLWWMKKLANVNLQIERQSIHSILLVLKVVEINCPYLWLPAVCGALIVSVLSATLSPYALVTSQAIVTVGPSQLWREAPVSTPALRPYLYVALSQSFRELEVSHFRHFRSTVIDLLNQIAPARFKKAKPTHLKAKGHFLFLWLRYFDGVAYRLPQTKLGRGSRGVWRQCEGYRWSKVLAKGSSTSISSRPF